MAARDEKERNRAKEIRERRPREKGTGKRENREMEDADYLPYSWASGYLPVKKIQNGVIYTSDGRYVRILEVMPLNFLLRSPGEQRSILSSFMGYLKIAPAKLQFKTISKKADIAELLERVQAEIDREEDVRCRLLQEDYKKLLRTLGKREAISRRFFLIFEYEPANRSGHPSEKEIHQWLYAAAETARKYLSLCGNVVPVHENETRFCADVLYQLLNRRTSVSKSLSDRIREVTDWYRRENGEESLSSIPVTEFFSPRGLDFTHWNCVAADGVYHTYLYIPSGKYRQRVSAGWLSLLINAGEGIDVDLFLYRQDKVKSLERIGRQIRMNNSRIKETYRMNSDYDALAESTRAGYFLKNGLGNNEDFYYLAILITVTGRSAKEAEWRAKELTKLLNSQDIGAVLCRFQEETAFLSALPLLNLDKGIYNRSKRNVLTSGAAACYPFASYEMSDKDGIMMGVNRTNSSLVLVDIFNTEIYKNANITILGTSGAGKTFTMQLMALRMRRKHIQVFIIAPFKGHEFARATRNIGGEFIRISAGSQNCINIMELRCFDRRANEILDGQEGKQSLLSKKIQSLHIFFAILIPDMTYEEKQLLDSALIAVYGKKGITHDNESLWDEKRPGSYKEMPVLGDLQEILFQREKTQRLANVLDRLVHGSASSFNQQTNVDLSNQYVVLDVSELTEDLALGMFVALDFIWEEVKRDRTQKKAVFIDEVWRPLSQNDLEAEYILEIFKTIRAYGGSAVCATPDLEDFFALKDGKYGKGILNNSKTKIILNMENREAEQVSRELGLSESECMAIQKFERGNGLITTNQNHLLIQFKASPLEKDLITTDRKDLAELKERLEKYGDGGYGKGEQKR